MNRTITILLLSIGVASAAHSPTSLAGTVFRDEGIIVHVRSGWERTIIFKSDTEYRYVKALRRSLVGSPWSVEPAPSDGTYVYTKTGPSTGELTLTDPFLQSLAPALDVPRALKLEFVDDTVDLDVGIRGDAGRGKHDFFDGRFALTRLATIKGQSAANVSMRGKASTESPLIVGFVLQGDYQEAMIRVVGPSLRAFGVSSPWANPRFQLYRSGSSTPISGGDGPRHGIAYYDDWSRNETIASGLSRLFSYSGAFSLEVGARDAVGVTPRMESGAYTIVCVPDEGEAGGDVLIEVYMLP